MKPLVILIAVAAFVLGQKPIGGLAGNNAPVVCTSSPGEILFAGADGTCSGSISLLWDDTEKALTIGDTAFRATASRVLLIHPTTATDPGGFRLMPGTSASTSNLRIYNSQDLTLANNGFIRFGLNLTDAHLDIAKTGTGTIPPVLTIGGDSTDATGIMADVAFRFAGDTKFNFHKDGVLTATSYIQPLSTPSSSSAACTAGSYADDTSFHYVCTATNTWKRVALSAF